MVGGVAAVFHRAVGVAELLLDLRLGFDDGADLELDLQLAAGVALVGAEGAGRLDGAREKLFAFARVRFPERGLNACAAEHLVRFDDAGGPRILLDEVVEHGGGLDVFALREEDFGAADRDRRAKRLVVVARLGPRGGVALLGERPFLGGEELLGGGLELEGGVLAARGGDHLPELRDGLVAGAELHESLALEEEGVLGLFGIGVVLGEEVEVLGSRLGVGGALFVGFRRKRGVERAELEEHRRDGVGLREVLDDRLVGGDRGLLVLAERGNGLVERGEEVGAVVERDEEDLRVELRLLGVRVELAALLGVGKLLDDRGVAVRDGTDGAVGGDETRFGGLHGIGFGPGVAVAGGGRRLAGIEQVRGRCGGRDAAAGLVPRDRGGAELVDRPVAQGAGVGVIRVEDFLRRALVGGDAREVVRTRVELEVPAAAFGVGVGEAAVGAG